MPVSKRDAGPRPEVSVVLERLGSWLRQVTPRSEWNAVALSTLAEVARQGPRRVTDLVAAERITQPGMTSVLSRLDAAGLVSRAPDPSDGRATLVSVTPRGRNYLAEIHEIRARTIDERIRCLSPEHQQALVDAVDAMEALVALAPTPGVRLR